MRKESPTSTFRRLGFAEPAKVARLLEGVMDEWWPVLDDLSLGADPDRGLLTLLRISEQSPEEFQLILTNPSVRRAATAITAMSTALGDMLVTHPEWLHDFVGLSDQGNGEQLEANNDPDNRTDIAEALQVRDGVASVEWDDGVGLLRSAYYRRLLAIAARDLTSENPIGDFTETARRISDLVDDALEGALALARAVTPDEHKARLSIIAMGKLGGRELNYISDVDVIFVAEPAAEGGEGEVGDGTNDHTGRGSESEDEALEISRKLASTLTAAVSGPGTVPALWPLDANLRPEGQDGPLVRTLASHVAYYERWAHDWEFQALLKARHSAGDRELGESYVEAIAPFVWSASQREGFVESSRRMRKRVESTIASQSASRQIKLGAGGLRDVEFSVQLLQLVHGRVDEALRVRSTLGALEALKNGGYVSRDNADKLDKHYRFLRTLEHRMQLQNMRRSHVLPDQPEQLRRLARSMKIPSMTSPDHLETRWQEVKNSVRTLHQTIYYRPLLPAAARLSDEEIALDRDAAADRLAAIGYRDPAGAIRHITALTEGVSRTAKIQRQLLPVLLGWFSDGPDPDSGLLHFRILSETMGRTHWYMKLLRDSGMAAQRLAHILSTSRYLAEAMPGLPECVAWLEGEKDLHPLSIEALHLELDALISRRTSPEGIALVGRYLRRRMLLRTGMALVLGIIDTRSAQKSITLASEIAIVAALRAATDKVLVERGLDETPSRYLIIGMGSLGGADMSYPSDADIMIVHDPLIEDRILAQKVAVDIAASMMALLTEGSDEPPLKVDADLRPEGRNGPLARSLDSYRDYYDRWVYTWERQALLRARPVAGDSDLGREFITMIEPVRYLPELSQAETRDVKRMKARIEAERAPRGEQKQRHLKLGPGGIADVEWTVQFLQLAHAGEHPSLRTTSTMDGLEALRSLGYLSEDDTDRLSESWLYAQQLRLAIALGTGRTTGPRTSMLPSDSTDLAMIAALLSHDLSARHEVEENYLRLARRARAVVERIFFGEDGEGP
ncbi:bifunctional [glutamine synthetase] adenylyltransferase/[glutamine synthetase]-adenylyl-L-tyrosine phosphorylase [Flaviflexus massiliensis]|uniref:bifunctional [glutamine synthetase] adenylyltransferase/[glutamine synthetase]-adenylyl-L-tyrosine phosphorylase n=1 Tax=Flaviflexus massiliensis TaxID=1522309 RepID=UPI0006D542F9|nr:bifunctional [glutamine synthetase] adenylyltransferase/[glutamine synthetase]-adenylyl-L-tyrosine phosphorylase [Flaviflexus massiliensis]